MIAPAVASVRRRIIRPTVVLPLPLSPIRETTSPGSTPKLTSETAVIVSRPNIPVLKTFVTPVDLEHQAAAFQQAAYRLGAISTNGGSSAHFSLASGQRARKRQPVGGLRSEGGRPGMPAQPLLGEAHARPRAASRAGASCTGCCGSWVISAADAFSTSLPAYMTRIVSAIW